MAASDGLPGCNTFHNVIGPINRRRSKQGFSPSSRRRITPARLAVHASLSVIVCLCLGCSRSPAPPSAILFIVVDTLRADALDCYGSLGPVAPHLSRLSRRSTLYANCQATAPWTTPAVASMMTGLWPRHHATFRLRQRLSDRIPTVAKLLRRHGYETSGIVSHILLAKETGLNAGFNRYEMVVRGNPHRFSSTKTVTAKGRAELRRLTVSGRPFFLFVHYFDPHSNYLLHRSISQLPDRVGRIPAGMDFEKLTAIREDLSRAEISYLKALYRGEIQWTDLGIGKLLAEARALRLSGSGMTMVAADHGEEFLDHGDLGHSKTLFQELLHVPLLLSRSDRTAVLSMATVSAASVARTILYPFASLPPMDARRLPQDGQEGRPRAAYSEVDYPRMNAYFHSLLYGSDKVLAPLRQGRPILFDLARDPLEEEPSPASNSLRGKRLLQMLRLRSRGAAPTISRPLSQADLDMLRDLGYLGEER